MVEFKTAIFGLVVMAITFTAFNIAFGTPIKEYISDADMNSLEDLGKQYVREAKPDFVGQITFFISSFWAIVKTTFNFVTIGIKSMIFDVGDMFGVPIVLLVLLTGGIIYVIGQKALELLRLGG